jgi:hypothetical protein
MLTDLSLRLAGSGKVTQRERKRKKEKILSSKKCAASLTAIYSLFLSLSTTWLYL